MERKFYSLLFKEGLAAAQLLAHFLPYRIPRGGIYEKYNNFTVHNYNMN